MGVLRTRNWVSLITLVLVTIYLICSWTAASSSSSSSSSSKDVLINQQNIPNDRLTSSRLKILLSALAHIRLGYVANRTPYYSIPPLLIVYSCKRNQTCGSFDKRMLDVVNSYYFSMLQQGSAFAYDMTWPVKWEWYFESSPSYMAMNSDQAKYYIEKIESSHQLLQENTLTQLELQQRSFLEDYKRNQVSIVNVRQWQGDWIHLAQNPSMKPLRDKYRLNHLQQKSDWFWLASRILFSRPTERFAKLLEPYRDLLGERVDMSIKDIPALDNYGQVIRTSLTHKRGWFRIGLRVNEKKHVTCLVNHIIHICRKRQHCHIFISADSRDQLNLLRAHFRRSSTVAVHVIAEGYEFINLDHLSVDQNEDQTRLVKKFARPFMDWTILSRLDYLVGFENDQFLKTAAWASQVHTDVISSSFNHCKIAPMTDW
ncbi:uncharacterized protein BX663DRAFT_513447 [Cokeromyces recurvatus]|uniref:uncharacterized protein n=1 Tax=Cokeromyces recurvatus TaxID=90255 RepID=UPI002220469E|nr:uncharacterized protein BX663DRAFT_513447 [Cokeromyces recurvatus]KAI7901616.1 hypothetical protein BX663DRAFT_513447 [Cokeromyces recurvatus]